MELHICLEKHGAWTLMFAFFEGQLRLITLFQN